MMNCCSKMVRAWLLMALWALCGVAWGGAQAPAASAAEAASMAAAASAVGVGAPITASVKRAWAEANGYRLGAGDIIDIAVYGQPDLTRTKLKLSGTGMISFPFGTVSAVGMTLDELEKAIANGLRNGYLVNPQVSVDIEQYRPFFIYGQVMKPGAYSFEPGLSVRKAVAMAGGFTERASADKIFIVREGDPTETSRHIELGGAVNPGDTLKVEESFF